MSYMQFRQQCFDCKKIWNAAFGMVGHTIIAQAPDKCPHCGSVNIGYYAEGWEPNVTAPEIGDDLNSPPNT